MRVRARVVCCLDYTLNTFAIWFVVLIVPNNQRVMHAWPFWSTYARCHRIPFTSRARCAHICVHFVCYIVEAITHAFCITRAVCRSAGSCVNADRLKARCSDDAISLALAIKGPLQCALAYETRHYVLIQRSISL